MDKEKLAFFAPNDRKYTFNVMPLGPTNTPTFYTAMMKDMKDEWDTLFVIRITAMLVFEGKTITVSAARIITIGRKNLIVGSKTIIVDILLWCNRKLLAIVYFECVCAI